jgi:heat shock protein HtpX
MKRIFLFVVTNLAVVLVLSIVARVTGLDQWLAIHGQSYYGLLVFAALFGFGGSLISLAMSKTVAKHSMGVQVIDPQTTDPTGRWLLGVVEHHARTVGVGMPEVGIFQQTDPNAFATGMSRNSALVAVSSGLLQRMGRDEVEAVLGHEMTHVANGDMVTLALLQGVMNTFVIFLSRVIGGLIGGRSDDNRGGGIGYFVTVIVLQLVLGVLASIIVMWFSRRREFRADRGGAQLAGKPKMIAALEDLKSVHEPLPSKQFAAFGIAEGPVSGGLKRLFMSHPPLDERIAALQALNIN